MKYDKATVSRSGRTCESKYSNVVEIALSTIDPSKISLESFGIHVLKLYHEVSRFLIIRKMTELLHFLHNYFLPITISNRGVIWTKVRLLRNWTLL